MFADLLKESGQGQSDVFWFDHSVLWPSKRRFIKREWLPLKSRLNDVGLVVRSEAVKVLTCYCQIAGSFVYRRTLCKHGSGNFSVPFKSFSRIRSLCLHSSNSHGQNRGGITLTTSRGKLSAALVGSTELGCPTANVDESVVDALPSAIQEGVYYGYARIAGGRVENMVMSIGRNPQYEGKRLTMRGSLCFVLSQNHFTENQLMDLYSVSSARCTNLTQKKPWLLQYKMILPLQRKNWKQR
ncbi:unnamed protein product, partial [Mesorhabditis belari]|uniref:riboflavin kinase n=1 Tax=Mesorhabditis belari TaxID=2138241 RepID=A0AAF3FQU5_9BILA